MKLYKVWCRNYPEPFKGELSPTQLERVQNKGFIFLDGMSAVFNLYHNDLIEFEERLITDDYSISEFISIEKRDNKINSILE
jgi:hypothetical protein